MITKTAEEKKIATAAYQKSYQRSRILTKEQRLAKNAYQLAWKKANPDTEAQKLAIAAHRKTDKFRNAVAEYHKTDKYKKYAANYRNSDVGKDAHTKGNLKWQAENTVKHAAHKAVTKAIKLGQLTRPEQCEGCTVAHDIINAHHDNYAKLLVVRWLCHQCHATWHKDNGPGLNG